MMSDLMQIVFVLWAEIQKIMDAILPVIGYAALAYFATRFTLAIAQAIVRTTKTLDNEARRAELQAEAAKAQAEIAAQQRAQQAALEASTRLIDESSVDDLEDVPEDAPRPNRQQTPAG